MKMDDEKRRKNGITRREFMQYSAAAGAALAIPGLLGGCSDSTESSPTDNELRTFYFDLSDADAAHDFYLMAGRHYLKLSEMTAGQLISARSSNPMLSLVPDAHITHFLGNVPLSSENISLCWIVGKDPSNTDGTWEMPLMFYHLPAHALRKAAQWPGVTADPGVNKFRFYGSDPSAYAGDPEAYVWADNFKTWQDQATALVFGHQELLCGEATSAAHIQKNIISPQPKTALLAEMLQYQGPATENGGWATQEVYINPDTGEPYLNSKGQKQYFPRWSQYTLEGTGGAIQPSLNQAKNDPTLGANITDLDPTQQNDEVNGKIWKVRDGITTVAGNGDSIGSAPTHTLTDQSCKHGYKASIENVSDDLEVTFRCHNWYLRYLGVYVRFLDANNNPIAVADLPSSTTDAFPSWGIVFKEEYDNFAFLLDAEWVILGIPVKSTHQELQFPWPAAASSALILASGFGTGENDYKNLPAPGICLTGALNLATPTIFLFFGAPLGYAEWVKRFKDEPVEAVKLFSAVVSELMADGVLAAGYNDPKVLIEVAKTLGEALLKKGTEWLVSSIIQALGGAEAKDAIPVIGAIMNAFAAGGMVAEIIETSVEIRRSPQTYVSTLTFTHNITVTIHHDPNDFEFPATATHYTLKAFFDSGTPHVSGSIPMPGTSWSDPLTYTFSSVPYGGKVKIWVGFYSDNNWLSGQGSTDNIANNETAEQVTITITENKVPLRINTVYSHKQKTGLDKSGNLVWEAVAAPTATKADLNCGNLNGDLCELTGITVSEHFAAAGYNWKSFSSGVTGCGSGELTQLFLFANMSMAQDPESGHETSGCGFSETVRMVYDLMGSQNSNFYLDSSSGSHLVRQIRLAENEKPEFDGPDSNRCWGALNADSDALLLHPSRKLISINNEFDKIEVLNLPDSAVTDQEAHHAQIYSATGTREGLISGPICGAIAPDGAILVLESENQRIQAFDLGGNPAKHFGSGKDKYFVPLKTETAPVTYLDMAVEYVGYIYVLSYITQQGLYQYRLDIYTPEGDWLCRTTGMNAAKVAVDFWRNAYALNYEILKYPDGSLPDVTEPTVSQWIPSTP